MALTCTLPNVKRSLSKLKRRTRNSSISISTNIFRLLDLPTELVVLILSNIPFPAVLFYRTTCRTFNALITTAAPIQYVIALESHGLCDDASYVLSPADRIRRLTAREEAWRTFSPQYQNIRLHRDHRVSWINHLADGVLFLGDCGTHRTANEPAKALMSLVLPADSYRRFAYWNKINLVGRDILNIGSAIQAHDLIAIVTAKPDTHSNNVSVIQVHLLQFSSGKAHPDTTRHRFTIIRLSEVARRPQVSVDILGSYLVVLLAYWPPIAGALDKFFLFDWKTGNAILSWQFPPGTHHSFIFLTPQIVLLPNITTGALDIFHIPAPASFPTSEPHQPRAACSFALPALKCAFYYRFIYARAEPKPKATSTPAALTACCAPHNRRPFQVSPAHTILLFHVSVQSTMGHTPWGLRGIRNYTLLLHRESLLARVSPLPSEPSLSSSSPHVAARPWKSWGPPVTRWLDAQGMTRWLLNTSAGQRHVRLMPDKHLHVLDFNPWHVRACAALASHGQGGGEGGAVSVVRGRTALQSGRELSPWKAKVYSELAYVLTVSQCHFPYTEVVMDEQRLVGFGVRNADGKLKLQELLFG